MITEGRLPTTPDGIMQRNSIENIAAFLKGQQQQKALATAMGKPSSSIVRGQDAVNPALGPLTMPIDPGPPEPDLILGGNYPPRNAPHEAIPVSNVQGPPMLNEPGSGRGLIGQNFGSVQNPNGPGYLPFPNYSGTPSQYDTTWVYDPQLGFVPHAQANEGQGSYASNIGGGSAGGRGGGNWSGKAGHSANYYVF